MSPLLECYLHGLGLLSSVLFFQPEGRTPSSISDRADLLEMNSQLLFFWKFLNLLLLFENFLADSFFFQHFDHVTLLPLVSIVSDEKSVINFIKDPLHMTHFSLYYQDIFSLSWSFDNLTMMCLNEVSFSLTYLVFVGLYTLYFHLCHIHFVLLSTCVLILYMLKHSDMCYCYFCLNNNIILNKINILYKMKIVLKVFNIYPYFNALCCFFFPLQIQAYI